MVALPQDSVRSPSLQEREWGRAGKRRPGSTVRKGVPVTSARWQTLGSHRLFKAIVRRKVSNGGWRGRPARPDGRLTLLTVDFHSTGAAAALVRSFRRFVSADWPVVVVQNGSPAGNAELRQAGARVVGWGINLGHALGLDLGMRCVTTQYTLICDPDSAILSERFLRMVRDRLDAHRAASVDNGCRHYHPICLAFETALWKDSGISMLQNWTGETVWDVGGAVTHALGGLREEALIPMTRCAGTPLPSSRGDKMHYYGEVYGDVFTNTYCLSRMKLQPNRQDFDGWSRGELEAFHDRWRGWVEGVVAGVKRVDDFPGQRLPIGAAEGALAGV